MAHTVHRLHMARVNLPGQFNPPTYQDTETDVYGYLIIASPQIILIDTGVGEGNDIIESRFNPHRTHLDSELARYGLGLADVTSVINSHLHFDHCGNNNLFPKADILIQKHELEIARTTTHTVRDWFDYEGAQIVSVTGDMELQSGIQILSSPGHTPGHQSVLVETADGNVLVAAQAAFTAEEYQRGGNSADQAHDGFKEQYLRTISRLKSIEAEVVYFSHDIRSVSNRVRC